MDRKKWEFWLVVFTIAFFFILAAIAFGGTVYSWLKATSQPQWSKSIAYVRYLRIMNLLAAPFALGTLIVLGLCIPKRLARTFYLFLLTLLLFVTFLVTSLLFSWKTGLIFFTTSAAVFQGAFIFIFFFQKGAFVLEKRGLYPQLGSLLLHLGFTLVVLELIIGEELLKYMFLFWFSLFVITAGMILSFFPEKVPSIINSESKPDLPET